MGVNENVLSIWHIYNGSHSNYFSFVQIDEMHFKKVFYISQYIGLNRGFPLSVNLNSIGNTLWAFWHILLFTSDGVEILIWSDCEAIIRNKMEVIGLVLRCPYQVHYIKWPWNIGIKQYIAIVTGKTFYLGNYTHTLYKTFRKYILYIAVLAIEGISVMQHWSY